MAAQEHRRATERRILDATETLLQERPFNDLTIEDVMASTGLTRTAFYRYFPDLESLLEQLLGEVVAEIHYAEWVTAGDDADFRALLNERSAELDELFRRRGHVIRAVADAATSSLEIREMWLTTLGTFAGRMATRIGELNSRNITRVTHPEATAWAITLLSVNFLTEAHRAGSPTPTEGVPETLGEIFYRAVFAEAPARPSPTRDTASRG
jgi:AcrR family transcriptional regulator